MKQFEYKTEAGTIEKNWKLNDEKETDYLNKKGQDGWELITVWAENFNGNIVYYFKRELNQDKKP